MDIATSMQGDVTIITISGSLDGNTVNDAQEQIMSLVSAKACSLVLDLQDCGYISSAGLRLLLMAAKQVSAESGVLVLSGLSDEIKDVMEMTGFSNFFKTFDTVSAAVAAIGKDSHV